MADTWTSVLSKVLLDEGDGDKPGGPPPGTGPMLKFEGPWFTTQLTISLTLGIVSFFVFSYGRTRWPLLFAPRTKLKGFSPHEAHAHSAIFGWIMPTIRTSEFTILQIVGLDAAVLLNFFKMSFYLFSVCSIFAVTILMPLNWKHNKEQEDEDDWPKDPNGWPIFLSSRLAEPHRNGTTPDKPDWLDLISDANSYLSVHLMFTYLFTILALYFTYKNYRRFLRSRQLFSLELVHSIPARTVFVTDLPPHLQAERPLAEYFEHMELAVESVTVCRNVGSLKRLLDARTTALLALERAWTDYVGNPSTVESYDPGATAVDGDKVDALEYLEAQFKKADEAVKERRRRGRFRPAGSAFVTFETMSSAQIACQVAHAPNPVQLRTHPAPEPRDIVWANMTPSTTAIRTRDAFVLAVMVLLLLFWILPISFLASLLSYKEIKKVMPKLGELIDANERIRAIVQNSLPSVAMIMLNALLPLFSKVPLTYVQGYRARSWVEYSLLKKYFLFLLLSVIFIFLVATTYWQLVRMHFFLSYVILQGLGIMPLQLLNLGVIIPRWVYLMFFTRTPRDFAELNAPPMINYGVVYPQAILMFVITMLYSVVQPLIVIFGAVYFGVGYVVYKYKLLFVFYKPYESQGQAWPITFIRITWGIVIYLLFMIGIFTLRKAWIISSLLVPLLAFTVCWCWWVDKELKPLSKYVNLSSVFEVQRGEESVEVMRLRAGHPVTWSQSNLSRRRMPRMMNPVVAPEDERTDYSQPPMANWYSGVLNTGKRRYGHPALNGVLPEPWLPLKKGQSLVNNVNGRAQPHEEGDAVVLTLRKRGSRAARRSRSRPPLDIPPTPAGGLASPTSPLDVEGPDPMANPWSDPSPSNTTRGLGALSPGHRTLSHRLSFDHATGVIMLDDDEWGEEEEEGDSDEVGPGLRRGRNFLLESDTSEAAGQAGGTIASPTATSPLRGSRQSRYGTYFHHPERRRQPIPGAFPVR
ncbi:hypothetical protein BKA70DRAFT_1373644 [Coprinopsis sp. MPI-PUGE-AT-0042]|nr:hypothetical protein BKA70DRAFT_1373644 [Coprinopsis sp. MPI-PUGE-AT-0042]